MGTAAATTMRMSKREIEEWLSYYPLSDSSYYAKGTSLSAIHKIAVSKKQLPKATVEKNLAEFYSDPANLQAVWKGTSKIARLTNTEKGFCFEERR